MQRQQRNNNRNQNVRNGNSRVSIESENQRERLIQQINGGIVECVICFERVRNNQHTWSCFKCFHVLHLSCVQRWSRTNPESEYDVQTLSWRCPVCQESYNDFPSRYLCFCRKIINPQNIPEFIPHSCGNLCNKSLTVCNHPCISLCHPGPCPPCQEDTSRMCICGKTKRVFSCSETNFQFNCNKRCNRKLKCKRHWCKSKCHSGPCYDCNFVKKLVCYCKSVEWQIPCGLWIKLSCGGNCSKILDCDNHMCPRLCHKGPCQSCNVCSDYDSYDGSYASDGGSYYYCDEESSDDSFDD